MPELKRLVSNCPACHHFRDTLQGDGVKVIAEIKRASPSKGWLCPDLDPATLARSYQQGGASAISVLTEEAFFKGSLADLAMVREAVGLPLLCKDFILEPYQLYEARLYGADAVLLIAAVLSPSRLGALLKMAATLGMSSLVEVHSESEVRAAVAAGAEIIGINNRNLADFSVDLQTTFKLRPLIPRETIVVSESGIMSRSDILTLGAAGINAVLVGEALVVTGAPGAKIKELLGRSSSLVG